MEQIHRSQLSGQSRHHPTHVCPRRVCDSSAQGVRLTFGSICSTSAPGPLAESRCDGVELRELKAEAAKRKVEVAMMKQSINGFAKRLKLMEMHHVAVRLITSDWLRAWDAADRVPSPLSQLDALS